MRSWVDEKFEENRAHLLEQTSLRFPAIANITAMMLAELTQLMQRLRVTGHSSAEEMVREAVERGARRQPRHIVLEVHREMPLNPLAILSFIECVRNSRILSVGEARLARLSAMWREQYIDAMNAISASEHAPRFAVTYDDAKQDGGGRFTHVPDASLSANTEYDHTGFPSGYICFDEFPKLIEACDGFHDGDLTEFNGAFYAACPRQTAQQLRWAQLFGFYLPPTIALAGYSLASHLEKVFDHLTVHHQMFSNHPLGKTEQYGRMSMGVQWDNQMTADNVVADKGRSPKQIRYDPYLYQGAQVIPGTSEDMRRAAESGQ